MTSDDTGAKLIAEWIGYAWDGLREGRIGDRGFPQWAMNGIGDTHFQGGQQDLRDLAERISSKAIERTRAEELALAQRRQAEASELAYAEGQRSMIGPNPGTVQIEEAFERGLQSILDRLRNPDASFRRDVGERISGAVGNFDYLNPNEIAHYLDEADTALAALAAALEASPTRTAIELHIPPLPEGMLCKWEHRDPATLYWLPVILKGPTGVSSWYAELPSGHVTIIDRDDHAELVPVSASPTRTETE